MTATSGLASVVVVDIGASSIRVGPGDPTSAPLSATTPPSREEILEAITELIPKISSAIGVTAPVVVGCPGLVDSSGTVHKALYIDLAGFELAQKLRGALRTEVIVVNDARLQACGLLSRYRDAVYMTLGTGVGGAIIADGNVVGGHRGFAGELGHFAIPGLLDICPCGRHGCLDTVASGTALARRLGSEWWRVPDTKATSGPLSDAGRCLGLAARQLCTILDPEAVLVAGHLVRHREFTQELRQTYGDAEMAAPLELVAGSWPLAVAGAIYLIAREGNSRG